MFLGILHGLEKFDQYGFANIITDNKPLVKIFIKMWQPYHNSYNAFYSGSTNIKYGYYTNHVLIYSKHTDYQDKILQKNKEISWMKLSIDVINITADIPACMLISDIEEATQNDTYLQELKAYII